MNGGGQAEVLLGVDALTACLSDRRRVGLLVDEGVAQSPVVRSVRMQLDRARCRVDEVVLVGAGDLESVTALARELAPVDMIVGVGGGSLIDQAKLAALIQASAEVSIRLSVPQRSGLVILPTTLRRSVPLVAVPTTLGTGSESSVVACLRSAHGKRLVMSRALRPDVAVLDASATATLPGELVAEGVLEALFRTVSAYVGDHRGAPVEDALAETAAVRLTLLGHRVGAGRPADAASRLEIARWSGLTHADWFTRGRPPFSSKGWMIANELSASLGLRKMTAIAAVLPPLWRMIGAGETRLGSAERLNRIWDRMRAADPAGLPSEAAEGMAALIDAWRIRRLVVADVDQISTVATRIVRAWGAGLPMLEGLDAADLRPLIAEATHAGPSSAAWAAESSALQRPGRRGGENDQGQGGTSERHLHAAR